MFTHKAGFSLIELMVAITIISILSAASVVSFQAIQRNHAINQAKLALTQAVQQYNFYQLTNPYLLNDLTHNIHFETSKYYQFEIEEKHNQVMFIAKGKNTLIKQCQQLTLSTSLQQSAFNNNHQLNEHCW